MIGRLLATAYVATVAVAATRGLSGDSPETVGIAVLLGLPSSVPAMVAFYMAVGLLGLLPGVNPDESSSSGWCSSDGVCHSTSTGDPAAWFLPASDVIGILALTAAAVLNAYVIGTLIVRTHTSGTR